MGMDTCDGSDAEAVKLCFSVPAGSCFSLLN